MQALIFLIKFDQRRRQPRQPHPVHAGRHGQLRARGSHGRTRQHHRLPVRRLAAGDSDQPGRRQSANLQLRRRRCRRPNRLAARTCRQLGQHRVSARRLRPHHQQNPVHRRRPRRCQQLHHPLRLQRRRRAQPDHLPQRAKHLLPPQRQRTDHRHRQPAARQRQTPSCPSSAT